MLTQSILSICLLIGIYLRITTGGICTETNTYLSNNCTRATSYTKSCGILGLSRCTKYRTVTYSCNITEERSFCCEGYTGSQCDTPICHGETFCYNGGTCVSPDNCACAAGFTDSRCKTDINECEQRTSGCAEDCTNTIGSFTCSCIRPGYVIGTDRKSCVDEDECQTEKSECQHECSNTEGSYTCGCQRGYELALDKTSCEDVDECTKGQSDCDHYCTNNIGSYTCSCRDGFLLHADGITCEDVNECIDTTLCDQICANEEGSYGCKCETGFRLQADGRTCADIDECDEDISGCSQTCNNTIGSFICGCEDGFYLNDDEKTCMNIDDCVEAPCKNGGSCVDGVASFSCLCGPGFTGELCQSDVDECSFINGGCQDICTNTDGSFVCSCDGERKLQPDSKSCKGGTGRSANVFDRHLITRRLLPRGCATLLLTSCIDGNDINVYLSSTSNWYSPRTDADTTYTYGIVFVEINSLSLPVSLSGAEVKQHGNGFSISINVAGHKLEDSDTLNDYRTEDCMFLEFTPNDMYDFVSHGSFLTTFLSMVKVALPDWVKFNPTNVSLLRVQDLRTDLIYGSKVNDILSCQGAPVLPDHLYSVFRFDSTFALSVYNNEIVIPRPLSGNKFCLIVDICHNHGGTVFLMVPEESETILTELDIFKTLYRQENLLIKPRGIGLSVDKGINVHYNQKELQLWNGDVSFTYPLFDRADLWIGGDISWHPFSIVAEGSTDLYISVPSPDRLLTAMFIDEWNILVRAKAGLHALNRTLTLKFQLFGDDYSISFDDLATGTADMYMSVGGTKKRNWCGDTSNPPGIFLSGKIYINPFQNVPILKDWVLKKAHTLHAFVSIDANSRKDFDISNYFIQVVSDLRGIVNRISNHLHNSLETLEFALGNLSTKIILKLKNDVNAFQNTLRAYINYIPKNGLNGLAAALTDLWKQATDIESQMNEFEDNTEYPTNIAAQSFILLINSEIEIIKSTVHDAIKDLSNQLHTAVEDISGFGLKYSCSLTIFGIRLGFFDIEMITSETSLMECSRFQKVKELLKGEHALRIIGKRSIGTKATFFLTIGVGVGGAFGLTTQNAILQLNAYVNIIGIRTTADLFISRSGLYIYLEGNVWGIFLAQLDISAELGKEWHQLTFSLEGRFVAKTSRKRQTQTDRSSFQSSYLDGLIEAAKFISNVADKRFSQAQKLITIAQSGVTKAQNWLEEKKEDVRKAHTTFDNAVASLDDAKSKLEEAKGPYEVAIEKLNRAQRNVDNLCRIRLCRTICIPGLRLKLCKSGWFRYPCLRFTKCMISFPDPLCEMANLVCTAIRAIAFAALETAKIFVQIPMLALDAAKAVVSVAQFAVDKSRVVLTIAENILEIGILALDASKDVLELAKLTLEAVKIAIKAASKVLEFVIQFGLKNLIDVRNCGFKIEVSTADFPVFDVFCDVNAFRIGWQTVRLRINFRNILQSIWQAAKATIQTLVKGIFGRKRREIMFNASSNMHRLYRYIRQSEDNPTNPSLEFLNETIDIVSMTYGFNLSVSNDYDNKVLLFKQKCEKMNSTLAFLNKIGESLFDITNETKSAIEEAHSIEFEGYNLDEIAQNMTIENANISTEYAIKDYNLTKDELEQILADIKSNASNNPFLIEVIAVKDLSKSMIQTELNSLDHSALLESWILLMENETKTYFSETECAEFRDCVLYATSEIYDLYIEEDHPNITEIRQAIIELEDIFIDVIQNTSQNIVRINNLSVSISLNLKLLDELNVFCSTPPRFQSALENTTAVRGQSASLKCDATGSPSPRIWWLKNNEVMADNLGNMLVITNATESDEAMYKCMAGNIVANLTSNEAFLHLVESSEAESSVDKIETGGIIIKCYISTLVFVGVNLIIVAIQVFSIEQSYSCLAKTNLWTFVFKIAGPTLVSCMVAIISQTVIHNLADLKCNVVDGMIAPVLAMVLIEATTIGAMAVYVKRKGKWITTTPIKSLPRSTNSSETGEWIASPWSRQMKFVPISSSSTSESGEWIASPWSRQMKFVPIASSSKSESGRMFADDIDPAIYQSDETANIQQYLNKIWASLPDKKVSLAGPNETQNMEKLP